jgi:Fic family protein
MIKTRYLDIDDRTEDLCELMRDAKERARTFSAKFDLSLLYHENALEGIVFTSAELLAALDPTKVATEASMVPLFAEVRNHMAALDCIREEARSKKTSITLTLIKKLYDLLGQGIEGRDKAAYRRDMPLHRTYFHDIAAPPKIAGLLEKLVVFTATAEFRELHPVKQAASVQWMFMQAFPFTDNSGKLSRLLSNLILIRNGYLPVIIHASDRQKYYESFRLPQSHMRDLLLDAMENSLDNAFKFFAGDARAQVSRASNG